MRLFVNFFDEEDEEDEEDEKVEEMIACDVLPFAMFEILITYAAIYGYELFCQLMATLGNWWQV